MKKTALYDTHLELSAQIIDFGGWSLPIRYDSVIQEHLAVRKRVGVFDVSHMGNFLIQGKDAFCLINRLISNDLNKIHSMKGLYTPLLYENGTFVDDIIVYMITRERFLIIVNAANLEKDFIWIKEKIQQEKFDSVIENLSESKSLLAIQGKEVAPLIETIFPDHDLSVPFSFSFQDRKDSDSTITTTLVANTGYTGETGVEILTDHPRAISLFKKVISLGATPCGLGARDSLRLEKGYSLYGHEITDQTNALEAGLSWAVSFQKDFIGKQALLKIKEEGVKRELVGLITEGKRIPRERSLVFNGNASQPIGEVTSGGFSPSLEKNIALAYLPKDDSSDKLQIKLGNHFLPATKSKRIFV